MKADDQIKFGHLMGGTKEAVPHVVSQEPIKSVSLQDVGASQVVGQSLKAGEATSIKLPSQRQIDLDVASVEAQERISENKIKAIEKIRGSRERIATNKETRETKAAAVVQRRITRDIARSNKADANIAKAEAKALSKSNAIVLAEEAKLLKLPNPRGRPIGSKNKSPLVVGTSESAETLEKTPTKVDEDLFKPELLVGASDPIKTLNASFPQSLESLVDQMAVVPSDISTTSALAGFW